MNKKEYGTEITIRELKGHYENSFLTPEQFEHLLEAFHKQTITITLQLVTQRFSDKKEHG